MANTASGINALINNSSGNYNTATGSDAMQSNNAGNLNTALGEGALIDNTTGNGNLGVGSDAGSNLTTGDNNIDIGNPGVAAESSTIRIGTPGTQTMAFIAGISNSSVIGTALVVSSSGQLGIEMSSARFKRDVHDMGATSDGVMKLRPVTFHYKQDPQGERQYGLIAEEVARLYPELVSYGPDGKPQTVRYLELTAMLLNELQKQNCQLRKESQ